MNEVLAAIDTETAKCICGEDVPADGASLDYCSPECQYGYAGPRRSDRLGRGLPDGRTLNAQVARSFANTVPIEHGGDAMHSDSSTRHWANPDERSYGLVDDNRPTTRVMWVPSVDSPSAPTVAELAEGIDLTTSMRTASDWVAALEAVNASMTMSAAAFIEQMSAAAGLSAREAARAFNELSTALNAAEEPSTPEEFRRRALEHRQHRGTGPDRRDNRRWRNQ